MYKQELGIINKPASLASALFEESESDFQTPSKGDGVEAKDIYEPRESEKVEVKGPISGRVPASNGAMGLIQGMDTNLGAGVRLAFFRGLKEIGLGFVESVYDNAGGDFELPAGTALALKYEEKTYEPGSRYVKEDPVRKACDEAFRRDGRDVIWVESEGIAEIGGGTGGTLPIGTYADVSANLGVSGLIRYRRFEPFESASGTLMKGQSLANAVNIPITASLARRMPPGGEFEFTSQRDISVSPQISTPIGLKNENGNLGASATLAGKHSLKGETSISVQRLPFGEEVLVKIAKGNSTSTDLAATLKAGLNLKKDAYEKWPELGRGFLKYVLDRLGLPDTPKFVKQFLQSKIQFKSRKEERKTEIARYVFDLSKPNARKAYENIFCRLSLASTQALIEQKDASVRTQSASESTVMREKGGAALLGLTKVLLLSALQAEREGKVSADGRKDVIYRDCKFEKTYVNWFHGEQKIKWEAVTVDGSNENSKQSYFHLLYSNADRLTEEKEIEHFLRFAKALGIRTEQSRLENNPDAGRIAKILADRDDTQTRVDIYFTGEGIERLATSGREKAMKAYLEADADLEPKESTVHLKIAERAEEISNMWFFKRIFYFREMRELNKKYETTAPGRSLKYDARILHEARSFAQSLDGLIAKDEKSAKNFYMELGKASGFEFMRKIAALTKLATVNDTILHELSISGGGLTLAAVDEGEILHPEKAMHRMLTKIA